MLKEACVENFTDISEKISAGAKRIELCDNLAVGGTTVSLGVMEVAKTYCDGYDVPIMALIRPRGGDFVYTKEEFTIMIKDILFAKEIGIQGVVLGALTADGWIDEPVVKACLAIAEGMDVTFHMAFDSIHPDKQFASIDWLVEHGVSRILTHGSNQANPIEANIERLKAYIDYAGDRLIIMPGGGVMKDNLEMLEKALPTNEFHGTKIV